MPTINVSLLVFGASSEQATTFWKLYNNDRSKYRFFEAIDVRKIMSVDPRDCKKFKVNHQHNGEFMTTQSSMLNNKQFPSAVKVITDEIEYYRGRIDERATSIGGIMPIFCTSGCHRADSTAKFAARKVLNALTNGDDRTFNANVFSLVGSYDIHDVLDNALLWLTEPWDLAACDNDFDKQSVCTSPLARTTYDEIALITAGLQQKYDHDRRTRERSRTNKIAPSSSMPYTRKRQYVDEERPPTPINLDDLDDRMTCPCCKGRGEIRTDIPQWATTITTSESLFAALKDNGVDAKAMQQAFITCQKFEADGTVAVQGILSNLIKNFNHIKQPSAFVAVACIKYRNKVEPKVR